MRRIAGWLGKGESITKGSTWVALFYFVSATQRIHDGNNWYFLGRQLLVSLKPQLFRGSPRTTLPPPALRRGRGMRPVTGRALEPRAGVTICSLSGPPVWGAEPWTQFEALPNTLLFRLKFAILYTRAL